MMEMRLRDFDFISAQNLSNRSLILEITRLEWASWSESKAVNEGTTSTTISSTRRNPSLGEGFL